MVLRNGGTLPHHYTAPGPKKTQFQLSSYPTNLLLEDLLNIIMPFEIFSYVVPHQKVFQPIYFVHILCLHICIY